MTVSLAVIVTALTALVIKTTCASFIFVDWTLETPQNLPIKLFLLDYTPPIGRPAPNSHFPATTFQSIINNTLPAADYNVAVSALLTDGSVRMLLQRKIASSPDPPLLDSISTNEEEAIISYYPPEGENLSYYLEYFPVDREEYANFVETSASIVKLRGLQPGRQYRVRILSVFHGVPSATSIDTIFETKHGTTTRASLLRPTTATPSRVANSFATTNLPSAPKFTSAAPRATNTYPRPSQKASSGAPRATNIFMTTPPSLPSSPKLTSTAPRMTNAFMITNRPSFPKFTSAAPRVTNIIVTTPRSLPSASKLTSSASAPVSIMSYYVTAPTASVPTERIATSLMPPVTRKVIPPSAVPTSRATRPTTTTTASTTPLPTTSTTASTTTAAPIDMPSEEEMATMAVTRALPTRPPPVATTEEIVPTNLAETTNAQQKVVTSAINTATVATDTEEENEPSTTRAPEKYQLPISVSAGALPKSDAVFFAKEGKMLRVSWNQSDTVQCDAYQLNYTITTLNHPKTFSERVESGKTFALVKQLPGHIVRFETYCIVDGDVTNDWWATGVAELIKPNSIEHLRVESAETDEFYQANVVLNWNWPEHHDFNQYTIIVSYSPGEVQSETRQNETMQQRKDVQVKERGPFRLEKLNPSQLYTITVRNVSVAFSISSKAKGIRQITPPLITSILYPGEISSSAININFDSTDPEQARFDYYELTFSGLEKNITKKLGMDDERSLTFTGLIPGKTYTFAIYTVYEGVRSRPVSANITTYPNKVSKLQPVMGRDYVVLYWQVENLADNDCRYRLSYSGTANTGFQSTQTVELQNKTRHKFTNMNSDTYYTFTIIVIMGEGDSEAESASESTTVGFGPRARSLPSLVRYGARELAIDFENDHNTFSDTNGVINNYAIIVTQDPTLESDEYQLRAWYEVKDQSVWPAYRASRSDYNPFRSRTVKSTTFIIGENDCAKRRLDEKYCNGPLRPNTDYYVKIRSYSVSNIAMETEWVSVNGLVEAGAEPGEEESNRNRRPCHMYLNGCPKSAPSRMHCRSTLILSVLLPITLLLVSIFRQWSLVFP